MTTQTFTTCPDCGGIVEIRDHFVLPIANLDRVFTLNQPAMNAYPAVGNASWTQFRSRP